MKILNKFLAISLCFVILFSFAACSDDSGSNDVVAAYKQAAQKFIDAGDTQSAIKALEEGISATQDDSLKAMLDSISLKEETPATTEEPKVEDKPQEQAAASSTQTAPQAEAPFRLYTMLTAADTKWAGFPFLLWMNNGNTPSATRIKLKTPGKFFRFYANLRFFYLFSLFI